MTRTEVDFWAGAYAHRRIDRREFLGRAGALGLTAAAAQTLLAAGDRARAATPVKGGDLILGWYTSSASDTLKPTRQTSTTDYVRSMQVGSTLVRYGADLTPRPDLAEEWEANADATVWRFKLRGDVTFHNGKAMTLDDVIYSLNLHRGDDTDSVIKSFFTPVKDIRKDGDDVLVIELEAPNGDLPMYVGDTHTVIVPEGFTDWNNFVGTGPFKLSRFEPGVEMLAERYDAFYGRAPHVNSVSSIGISDTAARINALIAGDIHYTVRVDPKLVELVERAPGVEMAAAKGSRHITFPMMADAPPFDNPDLRMAIKLMADRRGMLETVLRGYGSLGNDTPIGPSDRYFCDELDQREQDLERARFHLQRADMLGATVKLHASEAAGGPQGPDLALHLAQSAADAGLTIDIQREPSDGYWSNIWMKRPFHMSNWMPRATADLRFTLVHFSDAKWNEGRWGSEELDRLISQARGMKDGFERQEIYCRAQRIVNENGGSLVPVFTDWLDARSERLQGWTGHPLGEGDGYRIAENAWLEG